MEIKQNKMNIFDKIIDYIDRNSYSGDYEINDDILLISFKSFSFGTEFLSNIFWYYGLDYKDYVKNFNVVPVSRKNVMVRIWLLKLPDVENCEHHFEYNSNWGYDICIKCGLFRNKRMS